jgi:hypothetical protein
MQYNYFNSLSTSGQAASCALQGPCFPVLTSQANVWQVCQTQTMKNLPVNPTKVTLLQQCFSCCNTANAQTTSACNATVRTYHLSMLLHIATQTAHCTSVPAGRKQAASGHELDG